MKKPNENADIAAAIQALEKVINAEVTAGRSELGSWCLVQMDKPQSMGRSNVIIAGGLCQCPGCCASMAIACAERATAKEVEYLFGRKKRMVH